MSLLMKALKQAERDHDEAINTVVDLGDSADSIDSGSLDSALRASASEEPAGNEIGFALDDHTDELPKTAHTVDPMSGQSDDAAIDRLDLTGTDFEEFDPDQIDDAIEQHSGVQLRLMARPSKLNLGQSLASNPLKSECRMKRMIQMILAWI